MKRFTLLMSFVLVGVIVFAQNTEVRTKTFEVRKGKVEKTRALTIIWENDFSDASLWTTEYDDTNPNNGPWVVGTTVPTGGFSGAMGAIQSTTAANGYALFDSDGVGSSETSQDSYLNLNDPIDCSGQASVSVSFESYYRKYKGLCYLEISSDNSTWSQYQAHGSLDVGASTSNPDLVIFNISDVAANQSEVYLRLRYIGEWDYAWMVDDIKVFVTPDHDLAILDARVNFFFYPQYTDPNSDFSEDYGYSGFYNSIPISQLSTEDLPIVFDGVAHNYGATDADATITISVTDSDDLVLFTNSATSTAVSPGEKDTIPIIDEEFNLPTDLGTINWTFTASEEGLTDENNSNNTITYQTNITNTSYRRDNNTVTGSWGTENWTGGGNDDDMIGVSYPFFVSDTVVGGSVFISSMTSVGTSFTPLLLAFMVESETWEILEYAPSVNLTDESTVGIRHDFTFENPVYVEVPDDSNVSVMVAISISYAGSNTNFRIGVDATAPTSGRELRGYIAGDKWYYQGGDFAGMMDLTLKEDNSISTESILFNVFPNPASQSLNINGFIDANITIFNALGQKVYTKEHSYDQEQIDISNFPNGTYFIKVQNEKGVRTKKVCIN